MRCPGATNKQPGSVDDVGLEFRFSNGLHRGRAILRECDPGQKLGRDSREKTVGRCGTVAKLRYAVQCLAGMLLGNVHAFVDQGDEQARRQQSSVDELLEVCFVAERSPDGGDENERECRQRSAEYDFRILVEIEIAEDELQDHK